MVSAPFLLSLLTINADSTAAGEWRPRPVVSDGQSFVSLRIDDWDLKHSQLPCCPVFSIMYNLYLGNSFLLPMVLLGSLGEFNSSQNLICIGQNPNERKKRIHFGLM